MLNKEEITWQFIRSKLLENIESSAQYPYDKDHIQPVEALIESYDKNQSIQDLLVKTALICKKNELTFTVPELWPDSYLFVGEGPPENPNNCVFDVYFAFAPLDSKIYIGTPFRNCIKDALPEEKASFANATACFKDNELSLEFLKKILDVYQWKRVVAVGRRAERILRELNSRPPFIYHPSYALRRKRQKEKEYIDAIKQAITLV